MKKLLLLLAMSLCSFASWAQDYDFAAEAPSGQTLYYEILESYSNLILSGNLDAIPAVQVVAPYAGFWQGYDAPTGALTIPRTVTYNEITYYVVGIGVRAFYDCTGLTSVTIPSSVDNIDANAFLNCSGLIYVVFGASPEDSEEVEDISIDDNAFAGCISLRTVYSLYPQDCTSGKFGNAERVITASSITVSGSGANSVCLIDERYYIIREEAGSGLAEWHLCSHNLPSNFIAKKNGSWYARNIVLTDDTSTFCAPVAFTADSVTYTREFADGHRSTLCLPFTAAIPEDFEVYEFSDFDGNMLYFQEPSNTDSIRAYTPYLVGYGLEKSTTKCVISQKNAKFPATTGATPAYTTTHGNMTFLGTMTRTCMSDGNYGYKDGFFVQSANDDVPFGESQHSGHAHVNPFRCYFAYSGGAPSQMPPHTLSVAFGDGPLAIDAAEAPATNGSIRYSNDVYDLMGRLVRKDAATLDGLPSGIYIWQGKKVLRLK